MTRHLTLISLLLVAAALIASPSYAHENHQHAPSEAAKPRTLHGTLQEIRAEHAALLKALESKNADAAHQAEEALQELLTAFPELTKELAHQARAVGQAKNLSRAYDAVHVAVGKSQWEKAAVSIKRAEVCLQLLFGLVGQEP